jgi:hypothetical protein
MDKKRHSAEKIVAKQRQVDVLTSQSRRWCPASRAVTPRPIGERVQEFRGHHRSRASTM